jgi:membrane protein required for colicin V production
MDGVTSSAALLHISGVLTTVDLIVIALVLVSMAVGFWTGFVWQFVRIAGLVASVWVSWLYHPVVAQYLGTEMPEALRMVIGAAAVFIAALLVCYLLAFLFRDLINTLKPEMPDRILGAVFGMFKGVMLVGFIAFVVIRFLGPENPVRERVEGSKGAVAAATCVRAFLYVLPGRLVTNPDSGDARPEEQSQATRPVSDPRPAEPPAPS